MISNMKPQNVLPWYGGIKCTQSNYIVLCSKCGSKTLRKNGVVCPMRRSLRRFLRRKQGVKSNKIVAPSIRVIHDVCLSVSQSLAPVRVVLDDLSLGIIDD
jgi:hypothetical protein